MTKKIKFYSQEEIKLLEETLNMSISFQEKVKIFLKHFPQRKKDAVLVKLYDLNSLKNLKNNKSIKSSKIIVKPIPTMVVDLETGMTIVAFETAKLRVEVLDTGKFIIG